ncbi:ATP:cob(I)alamin adenosyltransferase [Thermanaerovibrio velox DSM 12556]|uniref:Corrinoid adenosyltransferase n=1 Tax=Thermanaerovibrio velox DSM 12556 TaxID=926567 RepID=H0UN93_9BACT|nr:cob(I)yrinic acid a,c-diamide adenosyltransferase [Thermanaerovibrio velox]EHM10378.1 ATP:cob(I)alamin adenosyltransferase [Thermanaerovibrio velox DSM 12556]
MPDLIITTKGGDKGTTSLCNGERVPKDHPRVELYGTLDECQAHVGMARATCPYDEVADWLLKLEENMSYAMGSLAMCEDLPEPDSSLLETLVAKVTAMHKGPFRFVRPGDSVPGAALHIARTVARRAERVAVKLYRDNLISDSQYVYLNRLSDAIYALSLWVDMLARGES